MELGLSLETVDMLERFFRRKVRDWQLAEDLAQETVLRAHEKRHLFDGREPKAWLYRIARNILIDRMRKRKNDPLLKASTIVSEGDEAPGMLCPTELDEQLTDVRDEAERIERAMFELPDDQRAALRLFQFGRTLLQVAEEMGVPLPTAKSRVRLAREKIRNALGLVASRGHRVWA